MVIPGLVLGILVDGGKGSSPAFVVFGKVVLLRLVAFWEIEVIGVALW